VEEGTTLPPGTYSLDEATGRLTIYDNIDYGTYQYTITATIKDDASRNNYHPSVTGTFTFTKALPPVVEEEPTNVEDEEQTENGSNEEVEDPATGPAA
jgi:hypothetical protein